MDRVYPGCRDRSRFAWRCCRGARYISHAARTAGEAAITEVHALDACIARVKKIERSPEKRRYLDNVLVVIFCQFFVKILVRGRVPVIEHIQPDVLVMQPAHAKSFLETF